MITAVLIDDDSNLRNGLRELLAHFAPDIIIVGEAEDVKTGVEIIEKLTPQVIFWIFSSMTELVLMFSND